MYVIHALITISRYVQLVIPEMATHAALVLLFAINLELTPVLVNLPLAGYHGYLYVIARLDLPAGRFTYLAFHTGGTNSTHTLCPFSLYRLANNTWHYDPTTIFRDLSGRRRVCFIKAGFYVLSFFYYIVTYVMTSYRGGIL